jgi:hypothetical protein
METIDPPIQTRRFLFIGRAALPAAVISLLAGISTRAAAGSGLGLLLGAVLLATLYVPMLTVAEESHRSAVPFFVCTLCTAAVWLVCCIGDALSLWQWLECDLVLLVYLGALAGLTCLLAAVLPPAFATGLVTLVGFAWLTWPIWFSPWLTQAETRWLVPAHPLMALNSVVKHLGTWDRAPIAYRQLTTLNEDVSYRLPSTIFPMLGIHSILAIVAWFSAYQWRKWDRHQSGAGLGKGDHASGPLPPSGSLPPSGPLSLRERYRVRAD